MNRLFLRVALCAGVVCFGLSQVVMHALAGKPVVPVPPVAAQASRVIVAESKPRNAVPESFPIVVLKALLPAEQAVAKDDKAEASKSLKERATHQQTQSIAIKGKSPDQALRTFCVSPGGQILAVVGPARGYSGAASTATKSQGEIQVFDAEGKPVRTFDVPFAPQAINVNSKGEIFIAGAGKLAQFDAEGKLLASADAPHLADALKDAAALRKKAEQQIEDESKSYRETLESLKEQLKELEAEETQEKAKEAAPEKAAGSDKDPQAEEKSAEAAQAKAKAIKTLKTDSNAAREASRQKRRKEQLKSNIKQYESIISRKKGRNVDQIVDELTSRLRLINSLAVSDKEIFYTCGESKGYGYALWRTSYDFKDPKRIAGGLSGCCGQMDIQCKDGEVFAAENSRHRIVRFDREGKTLGSFGNSARVATTNAADKAAQFGGCCNPMNLRIMASGNILTAESEGYVKEFTADGKFVAVVGSAKVSGGCKNVAVAASPKGDRIYFYDIGGRIIVLTRTEPDKTVTSRQ